MDVHVVDLGQILVTLQGWSTRSQPTWHPSLDPDEDPPTSWKISLYLGSQKRASIRVDNAGLAHAGAIIKLVRHAVGDPYAEALLDALVAREAHDWTAEQVEREGWP